MKRTLFTVLMFAIVACSQSNGDAQPANTTEAATDTVATAAPTATTPAAEPAATGTEQEKPMSAYENKVAELHTTAGEIDIRFYPAEAPKHVKNFIDLAEKGFYNGTKFHRVIPGFMIQGGDPNTISGDPNTWGTGGAPTNVPAEFNSISHKRGIVSMARAQDPNSASSQFFIVVKDSPFLDRQYTAFGEVTSGMEVADKIAAAPRDGRDNPNSPIHIKRVVLSPVPSS